MRTLSKLFRPLPLWFYPVALVLLGIAGVAFGEGPSGYKPLVGLPGVTNLKAASLAEYINALYILSISIGGLIGVVKISMAGVKYSMSDVVTSKEEAKEDIKGVLLGLAILLIPFIVLNTIYSGLTNLDVLKLQDKDKIELKPSKENTGVSAQSFIAGLPKPPFDDRGVCEEYYVSEPGSSGNSCTNRCASLCQAKGGVVTRMDPSPTGCAKLRCSK